ncbi:ATP phosphoribosyltransferase regulatory subunit [Helicovermis profundi]|uniref:ATP phosphoribosyltransferase regulatory subunit n=1 Tax=Helicovermis profundi TaxID=3065157 RepID=A0AAU9E5I6_9FIRM|nr:ATP phosphoribosyltransferase regulatory subunit [Clostridia bacterium S502]
MLLDTNKNDHYLINKIFSTLENESKLCGYKEFFIPTLETSQNLTKENTTVKYIDLNGKLICLRKDPTVSLTKFLAEKNIKNNGFSKYFYKTSTFGWNSNDQNSSKEVLNAGVEYFGNTHFESDIEILNLGLNILKKLKINNLKIDIGEINYFHSILEELKLDINSENKLIKLVESKNIPELKEYLRFLNLNEKYSNVLIQIPILFGNPTDVLKKGKKLALNKNMDKSIENLEYILSFLSDIDVNENIEIDLGFSNNQDYYSSLIFKFYSTTNNKPVLYGGRYNKLSNNYNANIPACGFAIDIKNTIEVINMKKNFSNGQMSDYTILYRESFRKKAYQLSEDLRNKGLSVKINMIESLTSDYLQTSYFLNSKTIINFNEENLTIINQVKNTSYKSTIDNFLVSITEDNTISIH